MGSVSDVINIENEKIKDLFLQQSSEDNWEDYLRSMERTDSIKWDYVILTASNEFQASGYRKQIDERLRKNTIPKHTEYIVISDPEGKRVGSGGATFNVINHIAEKLIAENKVEDSENIFKGKRILVIHSGGDSKRIPQYSAIGKLFSPVPRIYPDGRSGTLFDEFLVSMAGVPSRIKEGMLVLSGDVMLMFNPLQIDAKFEGAAAISFKELVEIGKNHGVFLNDGKGYVKKFLHKQTEEYLTKIGAVNGSGNVDLDTGAVLMDVNLINSLFSLISTDGKPDKVKFDEFVNEKARISFYGDFLYPLASDSTLEQYYEEKPEGTFTDELHDCRTKIWDAISNYKLKLFCLSPARFIHFGTTRELKKLMTSSICKYDFLGWTNRINSNSNDDGDYTTYGSYIGSSAKIGSGSYIENCFVLDCTEVGQNSIISHIKTRNTKIPDSSVFSGLVLNNGKYVVRVYGLNDNPKDDFNDKIIFIKKNFKELLEEINVSPEQIWDDEDKSLWKAKLYVTADSMEEALDRALTLYQIVELSEKVKKAKADEEIETLKDTLKSLVEDWISSERMSLYESFNNADVDGIIRWDNDLEDRIISKRFIDRVVSREYYESIFKDFSNGVITESIYKSIMEDATCMEFSDRIRVYYVLSMYMKKFRCNFNGIEYDYPEGLCFKCIREVIFGDAVKRIKGSKEYKIVKDEVSVELPVRINWGGGWTDTPPYSNENGGIVLNAALKINGINPIQIKIKRLPEYHVKFESEDMGVSGIATTIEEIQDCVNPYDSFALHKAALISCGIVPIKSEGETLEEILKRIGGGIYISTQVINIPQGSGLGTSSILAAACVKGLFEFLGEDKKNDDIYDIVLSMEQIMSTGGGWQDQVGGLMPGIKLISTLPGIEQKISTREIKVPEEAMKELSDRFVLVYTGQRRLARNLLRNVMGGYIGSKQDSLDALKEMKATAILMSFCLEQGDIEGFVKLMNRHWELSIMLDSGSTNTCIDQIFVACENLIDAKFIAGAGGGGFIMMILKEGKTKEDLQKRLTDIFQDSGIGVWDCEFAF